MMHISLSYESLIELRFQFRFACNIKKNLPKGSNFENYTCCYTREHLHVNHVPRH